MKKLFFDVIMTSKSAENGRFLLSLVFFCFKGFYFSIKFVIMKNHIAYIKENFTSSLIEVFIYLKNVFFTVNYVIYVE